MPLLELAWPLTDGNWCRFLRHSPSSAAPWWLDFIRGKDKDPILIPAFRNKFYFDELYAALVAGTQDILAVVSAAVDRWVIDGVFVRGLSGAAWAGGFVLRFFQVGNLQGYSFLFGAGVVGLVAYILLS